MTLSRFAALVSDAVAQGIPRELAERDVAKHLGEPVTPSGKSELVGKSAAKSGMNKTEARRAQELESLRLGNIVKSWQFEAVTLVLADRCRYTPDFFVEYADGHLVFEEVKGFWRDDARVKIKVAARLYPMFSFRALRVRKASEGGGWQREEFSRGIGEPA